MFPCAARTRASSAGGWPRHVIDRQPRRNRGRPRRYPRESHHVPVEVGLIDVAAFRGNSGGIVTRRETVDGVIETDESRRDFGGDADLRSEPGPQTLARPSDLDCE